MFQWIPAQIHCAEKDIQPPPSPPKLNQTGSHWSSEAYSSVRGNPSKVNHILYRVTLFPSNALCCVRMRSNTGKYVLTMCLFFFFSLINLILDYMTQRELLQLCKASLSCFYGDLGCFNLRGFPVCDQYRGHSCWTADG